MLVDFRAITAMPYQQLVTQGLLTPPLQIAIEGFLYANPPPGGILSERNYAIWSDMAANTSVHYRNAVARASPFDAGTAGDIIKALGYPGADRRGHLAYLSGMMAAFAGSGVLHSEDEAYFETSYIEDVHRLSEQSLSQFIVPWHKSLAGYVADQENFESNRRSLKDSSHQAAALLQIYAWYITLSPRVGTDLDTSLVHGIIKGVTPATWRRHSIDAARTYTRKLRQMIAIEEALGAGARMITGFIDRGLPSLLIAEFLGSRRAKDLDPRPVQTSADLYEPIADLFGRYFYLSPFEGRPDGRRLKGIIAGAATFGGLDRRHRPILRQLFTGLCTFLSSEDTRWFAEAPTPERESPPYFATLDADQKRRTVDDALALHRMDDAQSPQLSHVRGDIHTSHPVHVLKERDLIDNRALNIIGYTLYCNRPRDGLLSEASWRFWGGFLANLYVACRRDYGPHADIPLGDIRDLAIDLLDCPEDELPSIPYTARVLKKAMDAAAAEGPGVALRPIPIPWIPAMGHLSDELAATPREAAIAGYVIDQGEYENGHRSTNGRTLERTILIHMHDWYTSYVAIEEIDRRRIDLIDDLALGILARLDPESWERNPAFYGIFYLRKLRQMMALEKRLPAGGRISGYTERPVPVLLMRRFMRERHGFYPWMAGIDEADIIETAADIFGRFYFLRNFASPYADLTEKLPLLRLRRVLNAMAEMGTIGSDSLAHWERLFVDLYLFLRKNEDAWTSFSSKMDPSPPSLKPKAKSKVAARAASGTKPADILDRYDEAVRILLAIIFPQIRTTLRYKGLAEPYLARLERMRRIQRPKAAPPPAATSVQPEAPPKHSYPSDAHRFEKPGWFEAGWEDGRGGLMNRDTLIEAGLITLRLADEYHRMLSDRTRNPALIGGTLQFVMNIYAAYRVLGGKLDPVDAALLNRVSYGFVRHGRKSEDTRQQAQKRAGHVMELMGIVRDAWQREGIDISLPVAVESASPASLISAPDAGMEPEMHMDEWRAGRAGCLEIETLFKLGKIDPRTLGRCRELVEGCGMQEADRRRASILLLANIVAAYVDANGWSIDRKEELLIGTARSFVTRASRGIPNIALDDFIKWAKGTINWRMANRKDLFHRLEMPDLGRMLPPAAIATAEAIVAEAGDASKGKRERMLRTLLSAYHHFTGCLPAGAVFDIPIASSVAAQFFPGDDADALGRRAEMLERIHMAARTAQAVLSVRAPTAEVLSGWLERTHTAPDIPGLSKDVAIALTNVAIMELSSPALDGMFQDPDEHLRRMMARWIRTGLIPDSSAEFLRAFVTDNSSGLAVTDMIHLIRRRGDQPVPSDNWVEGNAEYSIGELRERSMLSAAALARIDAIVEQQGIPVERRNLRRTLFANVISLYFHLGGSLSMPDSGLLMDIALTFANNANVPTPEGYARYIVNSIAATLEEMKAAAYDIGSVPSPEDATAAVGDFNRPFATLFAGAGIDPATLPDAAQVAGDAETATDISSPKKEPPRPRAPVPSPAPLDIDIQGVLSGDPIPDIWTSHRKFLSMSELISLGLLSKAAAARCDSFIKRIRGMVRAERMVLQHILHNLLASYAYAAGASVRICDARTMQSIFDEFASSDAMPNLAEKRETVLRLTAEILGTVPGL